MNKIINFIIVVLNIELLYSQCPYLESGTVLPSNLPDLSIPLLEEYKLELQNLDIKKVFNDLYELLSDSQECWPADKLGGITSYGGLFVRLAWHAAGTFRQTDGAGGAAGGRQRYDPEASWDDNTNLDKARALLGPIKEKYGNKLSWGDLIIFAGTAAIKYMGGPVSRVCAGRIDERDGRLSEPLIDDTICPPELQGNCPPPLGASSIGSIYVNPEGVNGTSNPYITAQRIREIFKRMGADDIDTVALIGGGHAFGKCHGACTLGVTPFDFNEVPFNPWRGLCGTGIGEDTFTSGLEGQWTTYPFRWDNEFFTQLINDKYELIEGPGGRKQWYNKRNGNLMLTTDIALISDDEYKKIVTAFANDINKLNEAFSYAWQILTENGNGWVDEQYRVCVDGNDLPIPMKEEEEEDESDFNEKYTIIMKPTILIKGLLKCVKMGKVLASINNDYDYYMAKELCSEYANDGCWVNNNYNSNNNCPYFLSLKSDNKCPKKKKFDTKFVLCQSAPQRKNSFRAHKMNSNDDSNEDSIDDSNANSINNNNLNEEKVLISLEKMTYILAGITIILLSLIILYCIYYCCNYIKRENRNGYSKVSSRFSSVTDATLESVNDNEINIQNIK